LLFLKPNRKPTTPLDTPTLEPALHYVPEAYRTSGPKLMGRNAAGEAFMRAWLTHSTQAVFRARVESAEHAHAFGDAVQSLRPGARTNAVLPSALGRLAEAGLLYYPGPDLAQSAWQRSMHSEVAWGLCGITHTTASAAAMDAIAGWLTAPLQPWDAVICTSSAVLETVRVVMEAQAHHLNARLGISKTTLPMLPVIPLGVHCEDFVITPAHRETSRQALGIPADCCVVLYVGRLSFHAKAHPLPMYAALQAALAKTGAVPGKVMLIECGWFANDEIDRTYAQCAQTVMPQVRRHVVDGRDAAARQQAWAAADVFCSLSDNIQETFGLTPVEGMAAGLPCVVSDWNGYKDTVRDGIDGMRIPSWGLPPGDGRELARRHALGVINYDQYCGNAGASTVVDTAACTDAFAALFASPSLRATLGRSAQKRAREVFDWAVVYRQYEALWREQTRRRMAASAGHRALPHPWPARMDPYVAFQGYPTELIDDQTWLTPTAPATSPEAAHAQLDRLMPMSLVSVFAGSEAERSLAREILALCAHDAGAAPLNFAQLAAQLPTQPPAVLRRRVAWLAKFGLLRLQRTLPEKAAPP
jgi:alpha-maltose-1-phosphate synthase